MKYISFTIFIMVFLTNVMAQQWNPEVYSGIPVTSKVRVFRENFDNNNYMWIKNSSPQTHKITDGVFYFSNEYEFTFTDGKPINFDGKKDFELETRIKFVSGDVEDYSGLFWGELVFGDKYIFGFSSLSNYRIIKEVGLESNVITGPKKSEQIFKTDENLLTVRKVDQTYYFFINEVLVHTMPYEQLPGQYIGFQVAPNTMIQINFLRLWSLEKK